MFEEDDDNDNMSQTMEPEPEPEALDEPAGRSNLVGRRASLVTTTFALDARDQFQQGLRDNEGTGTANERLQGTQRATPSPRGGTISNISTSSSQRAAHTMPMLMPRMSEVMPVVPRPPPAAKKGIMVRKRLFALPGAEDLVERGPAGSRRRGHSEPPNGRRHSVLDTAPLEMPAEKMLRLVIWVQSTFRGTKVRAEVRRAMAVAASKEPEPENEPAEGMEEQGMKAAKARSKAKHKAKTAAKARKEQQKAERERKVMEREMESRLRRKFRKLDADGSGALDQDEVMRLIEAMGVSLSKRQTAAAMVVMDNDGDGEIDFEEFSAWWKEFNSAEKRQSFFSGILSKDEETPEEAAAREYDEKVQKAAREVEAYAKLKRKGKHRHQTDGLWPEQMVWVTYFLTVLFCLFCGLYTVMVALSFGPETTALWLGGFITTTSYQAIVQDPMKIGLVVLFADAAEFWLELYYEFMEFMPFDVGFLMEEA